MMEPLTVAFQKDHARWDSWLKRAREEAASAHLADACAALAAFRQGIGNHMAVEEAQLFPAYEARKGTDNPITTTLRKGHRDLRVFFTEMDEALQAGDSDEFLDLAATVARILALHDEMEETDLYPAVMAMLPDGGWDAVAALRDGETA